MFRSRAGAVSGERVQTEACQVHAMTFSLQRNPKIIAAAIEAIRRSHSFKVPATYVTEGYATHFDYRSLRANPNRFWYRILGSRGGRSEARFRLTVSCKTRPNGPE